MDDNRETPSSPRTGQHVRVLTGPFAGFSGALLDVDEFRRHVWVSVMLFGRATSICLDALQVAATP